MGASRGLVQLRKGSNSSGDKLLWKWFRGAEFVSDDLGSPASTDTYALCVYDSAAGVPILVSELVVGPSVDWTGKPGHSFKYEDHGASNDGVQVIKIKPNAIGKSLVVVKAKGANFPIPAPALDSQYFEQSPEVVVKLVSTSGTCWASSFAVANTSKNTATQFSAAIR